MRWQKIIEGAICSHNDVTDDVILKGFEKYWEGQLLKLEIAKTRQISNPGFGFESKAKPGFWVWVSGL